MLEIALKYFGMGFHVIPVTKDKIPLCKWSMYQEKQTEEDVIKIFAHKSTEGIAIVTGIDDLEVIDLDLKYDITGNLLSSLIKHCDTYGISMMGLPRQVTKSGGYHFFYRCKEIEGNQKLASRPSTEEELTKENAKRKEKNIKLKSEKTALRKDTRELTIKEKKKLEKKYLEKIEDGNRLPQVLIETRGKYGIVFVTPTEGYTMDEGDFNNIPYITVEQRKKLLSACRDFNEIEEKKVDKAALLEKFKNKREVKHTGKLSRVVYNESNDVISLLERHGWSIEQTTKDRIYFTRPAKDKGISADFHIGKRLFKSFSTSTEFNSDRAYNPFQVYSLLECNDDYKAASKRLYEDGYGDAWCYEKLPDYEDRKHEVYKTEEISTTTINEDGEVVEESEFDKLLKRSPKFTLKDPLPLVEANLRVFSEGKWNKIAGYGMSGLIIGEKGAGKSLIMSLLLASALDGGRTKLYYQLDIKDKVILDFDTEQPDYFYKLNRHRLYAMAGSSVDSPNYISHNISHFSRKERLTFIDHYIRNTPNVGLVMIDGVVDLVRSYNDLDESQNFADLFSTKWTNACGGLVIGVLHKAKSTGGARGHLGTELENKASFVIGIHKDRIDDVYEVSSVRERFAPYKSVFFKRDENSFPVSEDAIDNNYFDLSIYNKALGKTNIEVLGSPVSNTNQMASVRPNLEDVPF